MKFVWKLIVIFNPVVRDTQDPADFSKCIKDVNLARKQGDRTVKSESRNFIN